MRVLVSGATGLLGSSLILALTRAGDEITRLTRTPQCARDVGWNPAADQPDHQALHPLALAGIDAVVHLAGESIAGGRWTRSRKARILNSRVDGTSLLARQLAAHPEGPKVMICASAIGYYGNRNEEEVDENSAAGTGFLANVCQAWEAAATPARDAGVRVVHLRFGGILASQGGMLAKMLTPFKLGLGGVVGTGDQWLSWLALADAVGIVRHAIETTDLAGPVNAVTPHAVRNRAFTQILGRVLARPTLAPLPGPLARLLLGELADELLLASTRVAPTRLIQTGYRFRRPELEPALRLLLDPDS